MNSPIFAGQCERDLTVTVKVRLEKAEGRKLTFHIKADDCIDKIADGAHDQRGEIQRQDRRQRAYLTSSISAACLRVVSVISTPPNMRAISSMRASRSSPWMLLATPPSRVFLLTCQ